MKEFKDLSLREREVINLIVGPFNSWKKETIENGNSFYKEDFCKILCDTGFPQNSQCINLFIRELLIKKINSRRTGQKDTYSFKYLFPLTSEKYWNIHQRYLHERKMYRIKKKDSVTKENVSEIEAAIKLLQQNGYLIYKQL